MHSFCGGKTLYFVRRIKHKYRKASGRSTCKLLGKGPNWDSPPAPPPPSLPPPLISLCNLYDARACLHPRKQWQFEQLGPLFFYFLPRLFIWPRKFQRPMKELCVASWMRAHVRAHIHTDAPKPTWRQRIKFPSHVIKFWMRRPASNQSPTSISALVTLFFATRSIQNTALFILFFMISPVTQLPC